MCHKASHLDHMKQEVPHLVAHQSNQSQLKTLILHLEKPQSRYKPKKMQLKRE